MELLVYHRFKDKTYAGYKLVYPKRIPIKDGKYTAIISNSIVDVLQHLNKYPDILMTDVYPLLGSSVYAVKPCMFDEKDLRNNFKLKKKPDTGEYNVFSSFSIKRPGKSEVLTATSSIIIPSKRMIIANNDKNESYYSLLKKFAPDINTAKSDEEYFIDWSTSDYIWTNLRADYINLLDGKFEKPCIPAENLKLYHNNPISVDTLEMVYRAGIQDKSNDSIQNYLLQLAAMNLRNWRDYPGTVSILFGELLSCRWFTACSAVSNNPNDYEKFVVEMLSYKNRQFLNKEDEAMAVSLVERLLQLDLSKKYSWSELFKLASNAHIQLTTLFSLFNNEISLSRK